jgi:AraC-like DNA-binding protein
MGAVVSAFVSFLSDKSVESEEIFERSAINTDVLCDPNQPISLSAFLNAIDIAAQLTDINNFGLWFGNQYQPEYLGLLGYIGLSSNTLGEALLNMSRHFPEFQSRSTVKLSHFQNKIFLEYRLLDGSIVSRRHDAELTLGNFLNVMRRALGNRWSPLEVYFNHSRPDCWQDHEKAFQTEVRFEQQRNAITFNASDWSRPMPGADPHLLLIAQRSLNTLKLSSSVRYTVAERVRSEIVEIIYTNTPRIEYVADRLGLPIWTLSRQLKDEGYTFTSLFETVRRDLACYYLENSTISISKLAELLRYTETSSFTHAFTRWFGVSPKRWREHYRGNRSSAFK